MSLTIEAPTLEEAIIKAAKELECSTLDLEMKVLRHPSSGIFGLFRKSALIEASSKKGSLNKDDTKHTKRDIRVKKESKDSRQPREKKERIEKVYNNDIEKERRKIDIHTALNEIKIGLDKLFMSSSFEIDKIEVSRLDNTTIYIILDGRDAALLIGKDEHRYKALSYLLYSWINNKYGYYIKLEIAQFLKNQEDMIKTYLVDVIEKVEAGGKAQTKPLDGVLVKIALNQLRERFPDKYVSVRNSRHGRFVVVNEKREAKK